MDRMATRALPPRRRTAAAHTHCRAHIHCARTRTFAPPPPPAPPPCSASAFFRVGGVAVEGRHTIEDHKPPRAYHLLHSNTPHYTHTYPLPGLDCQFTFLQHTFCTHAPTTHLHTTTCTALLCLPPARRTTYTSCLRTPATAASRLTSYQPLWAHPTLHTPATCTGLNGDSFSASFSCLALYGGGICPVTAQHERTTANATTPPFLATR